MEYTLLENQIKSSERKHTKSPEISESSSLKSFQIFRTISITGTINPNTCTYNIKQSLWLMLLTSLIAVLDYLALKYCKQELYFADKSYRHSVWTIRNMVLTFSFLSVLSFYTTKIIASGFHCIYCWPCHGPFTYVTYVGCGELLEYFFSGDYLFSYPHPHFHLMFYV